MGKQRREHLARTRSQSSNAWLGRVLARLDRTPWSVSVGLVFLVAAGWRLLYLARLGASPLGGSLTEDAAIYWRWSAYLDLHHLQGKNAFFLGPLYPYVLALLRPLVGGSVHGILVLQALWGAAAAALLADAARRLTNRGWGVAIGLWVALFPMAVFFDGLILMESLLFALESLLLWCVVRADWASRHLAALAGVGFLIGLLSEGRASSALLLLPAAWCLCFRVAGPLRGRLTSTLVLVLGWSLAIAPSALHNWRTAREWIPISYNGGINLYIGNGPQANGLFAPFGGTHIIGVAVGGGEDGGVEADARDYMRRAEHLDLTPAQSSQYWSRKAREYVRQHPARTAGLAARKVGWMWNRREYSQIENAQEYASVAGPLGLPLTFAFLAPLAFAGLLLAWRRSPARGFVAGYVIVVTLAVAPFFVTDRYRHHLLPGIFLMAAVAADALVRAWRRREGGIGRWTAALLAGVVLVQLPAPELHQAKYEWGVAFDLGTRWAERGRSDLAVREYEKAVRLESAGGFTLTASERGDLYYDLANALQRLGRSEEALGWHERAVAAAPDNALAIRALADTRVAQGQQVEAESLYRALETKSGGHALALVGRARLAAGQGRLSEAESMFQEAVTAARADFEAWSGLIRAQIEQGKLREAAATLVAARQAGLPAPTASAYEALLAALAHDRAGAERALAAVPASAITADPTLADVVRITRGLLGSR